MHQNFLEDISKNNLWYEENITLKVIHNVGAISTSFVLTVSFETTFIKSP